MPPKTNPIATCPTNPQWYRLYREQYIFKVACWHEKMPINQIKSERYVSTARSGSRLVPSAERRVCPIWHEAYRCFPSSVETGLRPPLDAGKAIESPHALMSTAGTSRRSGCQGMIQSSQPHPGPPRPCGSGRSRVWPGWASAVPMYCPARVRPPRPNPWRATRPTSS